MLTPKTDKQADAIVKSLDRCSKKGLEYMSNDLYDALYLASGFIAHYDKAGFIDYYENFEALAREIMRNTSNISTNYREGEKDYEYYAKKAEIYKKLFDLCSDYFRSSRKYVIEVVETLSRRVEIYASSKEEAEQKVNDMYFGNEIPALTTKNDSNEDVKFQDVTEDDIEDEL